MPVVALLTDFGSTDHYVGTMKGVILSVCPDATLVDLVHDVPAHDVVEGALALDACYPFFPAGTVFVAVVDPGVGSARRALAIAAGRWLFVGPDNGIFTHVLDAYPQARVHALANEELRREPVSPVFHGRDVFAPAAAHLARGFPLADVGPLVPDPVRLPAPPRTRTEDGWEGAVLSIDRFGNATTTLREDDLAELAAPGTPGAAVRSTAGAALIEVLVGGRALPLARTYAEVAVGQPLALVGSTRRLEVAVNQGRADHLLGLVPGSPVRVRRRR